MNNRLLQALNQQRKATEVANPLIAGTLGIILSGAPTVEVPDRASYVYVQVRSSQAEVIEAFNSRVSPVYGLPVLIQWQGNRYIIFDRDSMRYSNWIDSSAFLPRHASTHEAEGSAGDVVFVSQSQFLPLMPMPSGSTGNKQVVVGHYNLMTNSGSFQYFATQVSADLTPWNPASPTGAVMVLVSMDSFNGNLKYTVGSGTVFGNWLTGTPDVLPFVPANPDVSRYVPIAGVRLISGTSIIGWDNIYDVRPLFGVTRLSAGAGGGGGGTLGVVGMDEGILLGTGTYMNFVGAGVTATISGAIINVNIPGGGGSSPTGTDATYLRLDATNDPVFGLLHLQKNGGYTAAVGVLTIGQSGTTENGVFHRMWSNGNIAGYRLENYHSDASYDYYALNKYVDAIGYYVEQLISGTTPAFDAAQPSFSSFRLNEVNGTANWSEAALYIQAPATHDFGGAVHLQDTSFVDRMWLNPGVVGAGAAQAYLFDTYAAVSTGTTTNLINAKNHGTSKFTVNANGDVNGGVTITFATGDGRTVTVKGGIITSVA